MNKQTSDTERSNLKGKSTEQSRMDFIPLHTNTACKQDNNTDRTQPKESPKAEASQRQQYKDQLATREDTYTVMEQLGKMTNVLQHIDTTLETISEHQVSKKR